jgi:hypothetical protein
MGRPLGQVGPKSCEVCGNGFYRRQSPCGAWESQPCFEKRSYCSLSCANSRRKGGISRKAYHAQARKFRGKHCEACGATKRLHAHHVNADWMDNRPENIQTLCTFCHHFWHALHKRFGINPSQRMPVLFSPSPSQRLTELVGSAVMETPLCPK